MSVGCEESDDGLLRTFLRLPRIARAIGRIVRPDDVDDIVQETFLRCYQASGRTTVRHPRSFMLTTARNLALNRIDLADNRLVAGIDELRRSGHPALSGRAHREHARSAGTIPWCCAGPYGRCRCSVAARSC